MALLEVAGRRPGAVGNRILLSARVGVVLGEGLGSVGVGGEKLVGLSSRGVRGGGAWVGLNGKTTPFLYALLLEWLQSL